MRRAVAIAVVIVLAGLAAYAGLRPELSAPFDSLAAPLDQALGAAETILLRPTIVAILSALTIIIAALAWSAGRRPPPIALAPAPPPAPLAGPDAGPPPAPGQASLEEARSARLAFRRVFPPRPLLAGLTYFGGAPTAPEGFVWPTGRGEDGRLRALEFLAQIDCEALPEAPLRSALPRAGVLYFFAPALGDAGPAHGSGCVRFASGDRARFIAHQPPRADAPSADESWRYGWVGAAAAQERFRRRRATRVEMTPAWTQSFEDPALQRELEADDAAFDRWSAARRAALVSLHGAPLAHDPWLDAASLRGERLLRPFEGFPPSWSAISMIAECALDHFRSNAAQEEQAQARAWMTAADAHAPLEDPAPADKAAFLGWLERLATDPALNLKPDQPGAGAVSREIAHWCSAAAILSAEACLADAAAAARIPPRVIEALRPRHSALQAETFKTGRAREHQMFGRPRFIGIAAEEMPATRCLLLQLDADPALGWDFGDGACQYWIAPADLAAGRFSAAVLTFESY